PSRSTTSSPRRRPAAGGSAARSFLSAETSHVILERADHRSGNIREHWPRRVADYGCARRRDRRKSQLAKRRLPTSQITNKTRKETQPTFIAITTTNSRTIRYGMKV